MRKKSFLKICIMSMLLVLFCTVNVCATNMDSSQGGSDANNATSQTGNTTNGATLQNGNTANDDDTQMDTDIEYTYNKVSSKIYMMPGQYAYVASSIPYTATFESLNTKVAKVNNMGYILAVKPGKTKIIMTNETVKTEYTVCVQGEADLIIFAGQSNMCGAGGNMYQAPEVKKGQAYEFVYNKEKKGCVYFKEPFGEGTNKKKWYGDKGNYSTYGTLASSFCNSYYKQTKTPIIALNCSVGGSSTNTWLKRGLVSDTQKRIKQAKTYLKKKNIKIRHIYIVWYQGESDAEKRIPSDEYIKAMKKIGKKFKSVGVEQMMIIKIGEKLNYKDLNCEIMGAQTKLCKKDNYFTMVSTVAPKLYDQQGTYYTDVIHINQSGLNKIGAEAGKNAGKYAKKHKTKK